jgi:tetratricopeptide (TPR) repeat protein/GTPase SAR1 family protein
MSLWSRIERRLSDLAGELIPDEFREQVVTARELLEEGHAREAAETLEALLRERPDHVGAKSLLGAARLALGDARGARVAFEGALELRDELPEALVGTGEACLLLGEWRAATDAFHRAVHAAAGDRTVLALAYRGRGLGFRRLGELDKAIRELRKSVAEDPDDSLARGALGEALLADPSVSAEEARGHLRRALAAGDAPTLVHLALGRLALDDELPDRAREHFEAVLEKVGDRDPERRGDALLGLAEVALAEDDLEAARAQVQRALDLDPRRADAHAALGAVARRGARYDEALECYQRALDLGAGDEVLRRALEAAVRAGRVEPLVRLANSILDRDPDDVGALVARGVALMAEDQPDAARATFRTALRHGDDLEAHLALARLELDGEDGAEAGARAAAEALAALRLSPGDRRARALLEEARARELVAGLPLRTDSEPGAGGRGQVPGEGAAGEDGEAIVHVPGEAGAEPDLYRLAQDLQQLLSRRADLAPLTAEAAQAVADFDRPLLVTVMGEFSSGKSTFVNAFIGHDVAPTGITPTTATINVVKYGRERSGRILYRSGDIETVSWEVLFPRLRELDAARAREIELVEILLPLEQLERINLVDTPGLNSILPEHEAVARDFIGRADAVVWLFTSNQAGKLSERQALESIRSEGKRVLGVLNKVDQLSEPEIGEVIAHVEAELSELVEVVVPVSARRALEREGRDAAWEILAAALEERFFARARQLKREACSRRLGGLIERARGTVGARRDRAREVAEALAGAEAAARFAVEGFIDHVVAAQRRELNARVGALYRRAAREVLELVLPRRLPFGSHQATVADRDYLIALLDSGFETALEHSRRQVLASLRETGAAAVAAAGLAADVLGTEVASDVARTADDATRLVDAQVFLRTRAYLRGYLRGGLVDRFFRSTLPKLELEEDTVYHALYRDSPDVDAEIAVPLAAAGTGALDTLARRLSHWAGNADVLAFDAEVGLLRALDSIDELLRA